MDQFIKNIVSSTVDRCVEGKKRLQKLVFLVDDAGFDSGAVFLLKNYGPYSRDIENRSELMTIFGELVETQASTGYKNYRTTVYSIPDDDYSEEIDYNFSSLVRKLDKFRTIELEIASTIRFFERHGNTYSDALESTKKIKPSKTIESIVTKANEILKIVPFSDETAARSRSNP